MNRGTGSSPPPARDLAGLGIQYVATLLAFLFAGQWLDGRMGTKPWGLLIGVFLGFGLGTLYIYRRLVIDPKQPPRSGK
jgi:F0F1-type ATP synthase assembly protein I